MNKTIEEAARAYADENAWYPGETHFEHDMRDMEDSFADTFKAGAEWLFTRPLSDRLTDEEWENIKRIYAEQTFRHDPDRDLPSIVVDQVLTEIFGNEMFDENKEEK